MKEEKTIEDVKDEINAQVDSIVGKINNFDSKKDTTAVTMDILNTIIAKVNLSKYEKAGLIVYLQTKRVRD